MTDSMKFGPEWLRNMSADSAMSASISSGVAGSGTNSSSSNNTGQSINAVGGGSNYHHGNSSSTPLLSSAQRNHFPQFRYGREELLSLFDKNCSMPEILPGYKKLFVEKVQVPLALTPSTDEETFSQITAVPTQRPAWMRRSPVGFSPAIRGTGRGGSVDRGRMRGKSVYHPIYQRPTAMYEDDVRSTIKSERGWSERNGSGDTLGGVGSSSIGTDWNGTPASSPRKEFSSHSRNMENWRKNRIEDGSGDASTSGIVGTDGWRGSTSFGSGHRWGRSTSWRDDDVPSNSDGYSGIQMQRSYSTISTTVSDRVAYGSNSITKSSSLTSTSGYGNGGNSTGNRQSNSNGGSTLGRNSQWASGDGDDLPEWAMENPSDSGGTFDATGAFHGSVDEEETKSNKKEFTYSENKNGSNNISPSKIDTNEHVDQTPIEAVNRTTTEKAEVDILVEKATNTSNEEDLPEEIHKKGDDDLPQEPELQSDKSIDISSSVDDNAAENVTQANKSLKDRRSDTAATQQSIQSIASNSDLSDRMQEVADDMVEKLIMDDDSVVINKCNSKSTSSVTSNINLPNTFVAPAVPVILKQPVVQQVSPNLPPSPSLPNLAGSHKVLPVYGGGTVVDHSTMQQHNMQQQQLSAGSAASGSNVDLWYYRDPQSKVQGPFTAIEMTEWYRAGYFDEHLYVRRVCDTRFRALGELIKMCHGNMPFTHTHLIPIGLDNINLVPNSVPLRQVRDKSQVLNDFSLNQQEQRDELKGNVTAAADSLSTAVKNLINPVDMTHILNMHFQMLQEQYLRHQEMMVLGEFSNKECFQRLTPSEREAVVRQKVQMLGLPEYLTSLTGLSNSLATLNPSAGNQLYDVIAECSKKDQHFATAQLAQSQYHPQQGIPNQFMEPERFILNSQKQQSSQFLNVPYASGTNEDTGTTTNVPGGEDIANTELINDFNLRMLLRGNLNIPQGQQPKQTNDFAGTNSNDFLAQQQIIAATSQSSALQMWIPQLGVPNTQQTSFLAQPVANQWTSSSMVHLPNSVITGSSISGINQSKTIPGSMWDALPLQHVANQPQFQSNVLKFDVQPPQKIAQSQLLNSTQETQKQQQPPSDQEKHMGNNPETQQSESSKTVCPTPQTLSGKTRKENDGELQHSQQASNKRAGNKQPSSVTKVKEESSNNKKQSEDDRRREQVDEKRRQKDEKKRQQAEEEKRRLQQIEEEKRRVVQEEKERQQQIHAQRRKAMVGNSSTSSTTVTTKIVKDQQKVHSSIAPWSSQTTATVANTGPSLAEIQKAERRERRADQQRQLEILEKQMRANNTSTAESNDSFLKWNASPVPVKSFAEIQAEEAKRLASEQLEIQRRKEQEIANTVVSNNSGGVTAVGSGANTNNLPTIWSGSKVWGSSSNSGFWEEPVKFSTGLTANNNTTTAAVLTGLTNTVVKGNQTTTQQKCQSLTTQQSNTNRNLSKSQTISTMQNTSYSGTTANNKIVSQGNSHASGKQCPKVQQKLNLNIEKKSGGKNPNISNLNNNAATTNKKDDYQNEFTSWCMKSLNGMNTKVDVPTFVTFLQDLESPYEVKDYVRMYLGENKEYTEFAKQFLERRSKYKNLQRAQNAHNDDMCKPAPAITPSGNDSLDNRGRQKKIKKNKMTKLDARILGFSVTAAEGRINVGDRDYVDAP